VESAAETEVMQSVSSVDVIYTFAQVTTLWVRKFHPLPWSFLNFIFQKLTIFKP